MNVEKQDYLVILLWMQTKCKSSNRKETSTSDCESILEVFNKDQIITSDITHAGVEIIK